MVLRLGVTSDFSRRLCSCGGFVRAFLAIRWTISSELWTCTVRELFLAMLKDKCLRPMIYTSCAFMREQIKHLFVTKWHGFRGGRCFVLSVSIVLQRSSSIRVDNTQGRLLRPCSTPAKNRELRSEKLDSRRDYQRVDS